MKNLLQRTRKKSANACIAYFMSLLFASVMFTAHAQNWLTTGNTLGTTGTFGSTDNKNINFITHNKVRGRLSSDGLWGFGTKAPLAQVHINSADSARNILQVDLFDSAKMIVNSNGGVSIGNGNIPPANGLYVSGKLGIGTSTPDVKLHVTGGSTVQLDKGGTVVLGQTTDKNLAMDNSTIQARNNGNAGTLFLNKQGGDININSGGLFFQSSSNRLGIGTTSPAVPLNVNGGSDIALTHGGYIVAGATNGFNLAIDNDEIQARNNNAAGDLFLNSDGGDVNISRGALYVDAAKDFVGIGALPSARFHVVLGSDATLTDGGYIVAGPTTFKNVVIDADEIQARNNGSTSILFLNPAGDKVQLGTDVVIDGSKIEIGDYFHGLEAGIKWMNDRVTGSLGDFVPDFDNSDLLGNSSHRWQEVWAVDGGINTSDARDKKNIRDLSYGLKEIMHLRPVKFNWKDEHNTDDKLGLIAQDLQKVLPEVVKGYEYKRDSSGKRERVPVTRLGVMYADIIPVIIKGMQQQQEVIEELNKKIEALTQPATNPGNNGQPKNVQTESSAKFVVLSDASLEQNTPNPFMNTTTIKYNLPQKFINAQIVIADINGKLLKQVNVTTGGKGTVNIDATTLSAGTYNYSLIVDGRVITSKQMALVK